MRIFKLYSINLKEKESNLYRVSIGLVYMLNLDKHPR